MHTRRICFAIFVLLGKDGKELICTKLRDIQRLAELPADLAQRAR